MRVIECRSNGSDPTISYGGNLVGRFSPHPSAAKVWPDPSAARVKKRLREVFAFMSPSSRTSTEPLIVLNVIPTYIYDGNTNGIDSR